jgi:hypothetical protein
MTAERRADQSNPPTIVAVNADVPSIDVLPRLPDKVINQRRPRNRRDRAGFAAITQRPPRDGARAELPVKIEDLLTSSILS